MKKTQHLLSLLAGAALLAASNLSAATTDPVGYVTKDFPAGASLISSPLQGETALQGAVDSVADDVVGLANVPSLSEPHFLLVTSGTAKGNISTILSSDSTSVTVENASQVSDLSAGDTVKIIEHFTLGDLTEASDSSIDDDSIVTVYNSDGSKNTYTAFSNVWYDGDFNPSDSAIIFPGEGVVVSFEAPTSLTFAGNVNTEEIKIPVTSGTVNLIGSENPSAPSGEGSLGAALATLPDDSIITVYSEDGSLTVQNTYTLFGGDWYDSDFNLTEVSIAAPATIVLSPESSEDITLSPTYTVAQ